MSNKEILGTALFIKILNFESNKGKISLFDQVSKIVNVPLFGLTTVFMSYFRIFNYLGVAGYLGPETQAMSVMQKHVVTEHLDQDVAEQALTVDNVRKLSFLISK